MLSAALLTTAALLGAASPSDEIPPSVCTMKSPASLPFAPTIAEGFDVKVSCRERRPVMVLLMHSNGKWVAKEPHDAPDATASGRATVPAGATRTVHVEFQSWAKKIAAELGGPLRASLTLGERPPEAPKDAYALYPESRRTLRLR